MSEKPEPDEAQDSTGVPVEAEAAPNTPTEPVPEAAPAEADAATTPPKTKSRRGRLIGLSVAGTVVVALIFTVVWLLAPVRGQAFDDPVDAETRSINTALYATLLAAGINDPFVDVNPQRAYVVYVLPNATNNSTQADVYQRFVIGAAADAAPHVEKIHVLQYVGADPRTLWSVDVVDIKTYLRGELDAAGLDAKITKTDL